MVLDEKLFGPSFNLLLGLFRSLGAAPFYQAGHLAFLEGIVLGLICGNENDLKIQRKRSNIVAESLRNHVAQHWKLLTSFPYHRPDGSAPVGAKTL